LSGSADPPVNSQVREKSCYFDFTHIAGMPFAMEKNEPANAVQISLLGPNAVTLDAEMPADAVEEARWCEGGSIMGER
jgi:hypothetical protein